MHATVTGIFIGEEGTHTSVSAERLVCRFGGIEGDRHQQTSSMAGAQEKHIVPKYRPVANLRQVTIVAQEELAAIAHKLQVPEIYAEDLSANIMISGLPDFTKLPPIYYLVFSNNRNETHAVIRLMGENRPCVVAGANMEARYHAQVGIQSRFVKAAMGLRGQVAIVYAEGIIRNGDNVTFVPHQPNLEYVGVGEK